jgi:hypothetical protein
MSQSESTYGMLSKMLESEKNKLMLSKLFLLSLFC